MLSVARDSCCRFVESIDGIQKDLTLGAKWKTMSDGSGSENEDDTLEENYYSILNVGKVCDLQTSLSYSHDGRSSISYNICYDGISRKQMNSGRSLEKVSFMNHDDI